jgi:hypothetical protein
MPGEEPLQHISMYVHAISNLYCTPYLGRYPQRTTSYTVNICTEHTVLYSIPWGRTTSHTGNICIIHTVHAGLHSVLWGRTCSHLAMSVQYILFIVPSSGKNLLMPCQCLYITMCASFHPLRKNLLAPFQYLHSTYCSAYHTLGKNLLTPYGMQYSTVHTVMQ